MVRVLNQDWVIGILAGVLGGLAALGLAHVPKTETLLAAALTLFLIALAWWTLCGTGRWIALFLFGALLLPPLPLPGGDSGPHPAAFAAVLGLWSGAARLRAWRLQRRGLTAALVLLCFALLLSVPLALFYSGPSIALGALLRIGLFMISVYLVLYLTDGPGRDVAPASLLKLLFWAGFVSAAFACFDFYFQFPSPARFASQFVWLPGGVYRRAQGVFYEASTLGVFCVFLLVMIAAVFVLRQGSELRVARPWLMTAAVTALAALVLSFSRTAIVCLGVSLAALGWLRQRRRGRTAKLARIAVLVAAGAAFAVGILYWLLPEFLGAYLGRLWYSGLYLLESPNLILSRRLESWTFLTDWMRQHPWQILFGIGYKTLPYTEYVGRPVVADNMYLSMLLETGLLGLGSLLLLHTVVLRSAYRWATAPAGAISDTGRLAGMWMFSFWCGLVVQMASGDVLTYWRVLPAFFTVLAIGEREAGDENSGSRTVR